MSKTENLSQDDMLIDCERSMRYHQERMRFFSRLNQALQLVVLVASTASVLSLLNEFLAERAMFGLIAVIGVLALFLAIYSPAEKAGLHDFLRRNFSALKGEIIATPNPGKTTLAKWSGQLFALYADEPPVHRALNVICANQTAIARGDDPRLLVDLHRHQRWLRNVFTFQKTEFLNRYQKQAKRKQAARQKTSSQKTAAQPA